MDIKKLHNKRKYISKCVVRIFEYVEAYDPSINSVIESENRLSQLKKYSGEFNEIIDKLLELLDSDEFEALQSSLDDFDRIYNLSLSKLQDILQDNKNIQVKKASEKETIEKNLSHNLPNIQIPIFDGTITNWLTFKDTFEAVVHNKTNISDVEKFIHLLKYLSGDAKATIGHITLSGAGYAKAWTDLVKRYDNKRVIVDIHIDALCNLPNLTKDNANDLRHLLNSCISHISSLEAMGQKMCDLAELMLINLIVKKFDFYTRKEWENEIANDALPTWELMHSFLQRKWRILENIEINKKPVSINQSTKSKHFHNFKAKSESSSKSFVTSTNSKNCTSVEQSRNIFKCKLCNYHHNLYKCVQFLKLSITDRKKKVDELKLCINCLRSTHTVENCLFPVCKYCQLKHNSLLCLQGGPQLKNVTSTPNQNLDSAPTISSLCVQLGPTQNHGNNQAGSKPGNSNLTNLSLKNTNVAQVGKQKEALLCTAIILIADKYGKYHECRVLLDNGSQTNYMSKHFATKLKIDQVFQNMPIEGIDEITTRSISKLTSKIKSKHSSYEKIVEFRILQTVANAIPHNDIDISPWHIPNNIILADPQFYITRRVDVLLGVDIFFKVLLPNCRQLNSNLPDLWETRLGWIIGGSESDIKTHNFMITHSDLKLIEEDANQSLNLIEEDLSHSVKRFWELESVKFQKFLSDEEKECERIFAETHFRDSSGRYTVHLPLRSNKDELGESKDQAQKRFSYLEKRFNNDPIIHKQYSEFMNEYIQLGHMKKIDEQNENSSPVSYYLPHHAVLKPNSSSTKLRVVFDASAKSSTQLSLNDILLVGPIVQQDLMNIILRFRKHKYVYTTDISKMYRQVWVHNSQTSYQRILWRDNNCKPLDTYELKTVTYGTASAPYLATRVINQLADDEQINFPIAAKVAKSDFFVDDLLTGADTIEDASILQNQMIKLLSKGGFQLHKWCSNSDDLLKNIPFEHLEKLNDIKDVKTIKVLGLLWQPSSDQFLFNIRVAELPEKFTKRVILSEVAKLYDPLGLLAPVIIKAKLLIQLLWRSNLDWDDTISPEYENVWRQFKKNLMHINEFKFPRHVLSSDCSRIEIHGFSDASERAYGACVYIRCIDIRDNISVQLLCGKSRVAPLKSISIPRLELCSALLLSRLVTTVVDAMQIKFDCVYLWSDSTITLAWINTSPHKLKTFVANRVNEIQELTSSFIWNHVPSRNNPTDLISRGVMPDELLKVKMWWNGPNFISEDTSFDRQQFNINEINSELAEIKPEKSIFISISQPEFNVIYKYSSFTKLINVTAYILRFIYNCQHNNERKTGVLTVDDYQLALIHILRIVQSSEFCAEIHQLKKGNQLNNNSKIKCLNPMIDDKGLLRVGGRLHNTKLDYDVKHQYILPAKHHVTSLIFRHKHVKNLHAPPQLLLSIVRQRFWPINGKNNAKSTVHNCIPCFKVKPKLMQQLMGNLPEERVTPNRPFATSGVDFCGPFLIKNKYQRTSAAQKVYIASFVCFVTKAIHLEIVSDMTSEAFIACLKRFLNRRGKCDTLWSDNAKTFLGAKNELIKWKQLFQDQCKFQPIAEFCTREQLTWKFIPPRAPNFGGLWESSIKSIKTHLKRVASNVYMTFEELNTLAIQIEGILNSRPLTVMSNDPNDPEPLTPGHFLTGGPIIAPCEPSYSLVPDNHLSKWQKITKMTESFWRRYSVEYIHTLQERNKWKSTKANLKSGDIVVIIDENLPSTRWLLGLVKDLYTGVDGIVRVVNIKTKNGVFKRSISKICKLPIH